MSTFAERLREHCWKREDSSTHQPSRFITRTEDALARLGLKYELVPLYSERPSEMTLPELIRYELDVSLRESRSMRPPIEHEDEAVKERLQKKQDAEILVGLSALGLAELSYEEDRREAIRIEGEDDLFVIDPGNDIAESLEPPELWTSLCSHPVWTDTETLKAWDLAQDSHEAVKQFSRTGERAELVDLFRDVISEGLFDVKAIFCDAGWDADAIALDFLKHPDQTVREFGFELLGVVRAPGPELELPSEEAHTR